MTREAPASFTFPRAKNATPSPSAKPLINCVTFVRLGPLSKISSMASLILSHPSKNRPRPVIAKVMLYSRFFPFKPFTVLKRPRIPFATFHCNIAVPIAATVSKISAILSLTQVTKGSILALISSIRVETASPRKSYSGSSKSKPLPPPAPTPEPALPLSGANTFSSSNPAVYCFNFLAAPAASSRLSAMLPAPLAPAVIPE